MTINTIITTIFVYNFCSNNDGSVDVERVDATGRSLWRRGVKVESARRWWAKLLRSGATVPSNTNPTLRGDAGTVVFCKVNRQSVVVTGVTGGKITLTVSESRKMWKELIGKGWVRAA